MTDMPPNNDKNGNETASQSAEITYEIGETELPSEAVVQATAKFTNTPVLDLDPLYDVMDPDHLDGLFEESSERIVHEGSTVTFRYNGCHISVTKKLVVVRRNS